MSGNGSGVFGIPAGSIDGYPFPGSPGFDLFHGLVDMGNSGSLYGVGGGQYVLHVFTNLNPSARYSFRGTVTRNGKSIPDHPTRWTLCSIVGARSFTDAHTPGTLTASTLLPGLTLTNGQVAFQSGINTNGQVVGWDDIQPAADGTFTIVNQPYIGATDHDTPSVNIGYILAAFLLTEHPGHRHRAGVPVVQGRRRRHPRRNHGELSQGRGPGLRQRILLCGGAKPLRQPDQPNLPRRGE
jgi:hypothetical protein